MLAPTTIGVVHGLLGRHPIVAGEVDQPIVVRDRAGGQRPIHAVHAGKPTRRARPWADPARSTLVASDSVTTRSGDPADDDFWRRPTEPPAGTPEPGANKPVPPLGGGPAPAASGYSGPPPSSTPPPGWRPPVHVQPPPPRRLPAQDLAALDTAEGNARTLTYGVGMVAGAVLLVMMCLLCSRAIF